MIGLGLLEAIPDGRRCARWPIRTMRDGDGMSGRLNMVWDQRDRPDARSAASAGRPSSRACCSRPPAPSSATSASPRRCFPDAEPHGARRTPRRRPADRRRPRRVSDRPARPTSASTRARSGACPRARAPPRDRDGRCRARAAVRRGGCDGCHSPSYVTGDRAPSCPSSSNQTIHALHRSAAARHGRGPRRRPARLRRDRHASGARRRCGASG